MATERRDARSTECRDPFGLAARRGRPTARRPPRRAGAPAIGGGARAARTDVIAGNGGAIYPRFIMSATRPPAEPMPRDAIDRGSREGPLAPPAREACRSVGYGPGAGRTYA